jgi:hypothetical protein
MLKAIAYTSSTLSIATLAIGITQSQTVFAQTWSSSASSYSVTSTPLTGQTVKMQQAATSFTIPNGQTVTKIVTATTVLDATGKPITTITEKTLPSLPTSLPGGQVVLPTIPELQIRIPSTTPVLKLPQIQLPKLPTE